MSASNDAEATELLAVYDNFQTASWIAFASVAFLIYDYTLTFSREVQLFWTRRFTTATVLYFVIRYSALIYEILDTLEPAPILTERRCDGSSHCTTALRLNGCSLTSSCLALFKAGDAIESARYFPLAVFAAMRAHSLSKSRTLSALIFIASLAPLGANLVQYWKGMDSVILPINHLCIETDTFTQGDVVILTLVSRVGLIIADAALVILTWRTLGMGPVRPRLPYTNRGSLASVMLWNGVIYFIAMLILNILHLALSLSATFGTTDSPSNIVLFTDPLMNVLVTRLMLDLQEAHQRDVKLESGDDLHFSQAEGSPSFARPIDSVDAIIDLDATE